MKTGLLLSSVFILFSLCAQVSPKSENGKWGYVDKTGEWVLKPKYTQAKRIVEGYGIIESKGKFGFVDQNGSIVIKPKYAGAKNFSEGLCAVKLVDKNTDAWGYIDYSDNWIIQPVFTMAGLFKNSQAEVSAPGMIKGEKIRINKIGEVISPPYVVRKNVKSNTYLLVNYRKDRNKVFCYVKSSGEVITPWYLNNVKLGTDNQKVYLPSSNEDPLVPSDAFSGNINLKLVSVIDATGQLKCGWYQSLKDPEDGIIVGKKNNRYGLLDSNYNELSEFAFTSIRKLTAGYFEAMSENGDFLLLTEKGKIIGRPSDGFEFLDKDRLITYYVMNYREEEIRKMALIDYEGTLNSDYYDLILLKKNVFYRVADERNYRINGEEFRGIKYNWIIDSTGMLLSDWYPQAEYYWSAEKNRKYRDSICKYFHAPNTNYTITPTFFSDLFNQEWEWNHRDESFKFTGGDFHEGMALFCVPIGRPYEDSIKDISILMPNVRFGFIDWYGDVVVEPKFEYLSGFSDGRAIYRKKGKFGAIDYRGNITVPAKFELMGVYGSGLAPVYKDSLWGYVNKRGSLALNYQYKDARPFRYGYAAVKEDNKWSLINSSGAEVLPAKYREPPIPLKSGKVAVIKDGFGRTEIEL